MNWTWFHKLGSPKWFYEISGRWLPWLSISAALLILVGAVMGLAANADPIKALRRLGKKR